MKAAEMCSGEYWYLCRCTVYTQAISKICSGLYSMLRSLMGCLRYLPAWFYFGNTFPCYDAS